MCNLKFICQEKIKVYMYMYELKEKLYLIIDMFNEIEILIYIKCPSAVSPNYWRKFEGNNTLDSTDRETPYIDDETIIYVLRLQMTAHT